MANEDGVQGIDAILDAIPEDKAAVVETAAPAVEEPAAVIEEPAEQPAVEEPAKAEQPAAEVETPESIAEAESQVAKLFSPTAAVDHSGKTVPVDKHIALRKRTQDAEAQVEALKAQQANVDTTALNELVELVSSGDDEYVDKATLKQVVEKLPQAINNIAQANINKTVQAANTQNLMSKIKVDEASFRKDHADYDTVTDYVTSRKLLSATELRTVLGSSNTAEALYGIANEKIAKEREILGIAAPSQPTIENQPDGQPATVVGDDVPLSDEEGFAAFLDPNS